MKSPVLELKNGLKRYGTYTVFSNLNLLLNEDEITVLCGPSGIGKTTLLKCLALLEPLNDGDITIRGKKVAENGTILDEKTLRKEVGIVFQDFYLWDNKTVINNITEALIYVEKMSDKDAVEIAERASRDLQINPELLKKYPPELSRGQRQRVAIARTLATDPEVILLDEPTASLDVPVIDEIVKTLKYLKDKKKTILIVTHDESFAKKVGDKVINFKDL